MYIGFDQPRSMGGYAQGGSYAAPIFKDFAHAALADRQPIPFSAPKGVRMVRIDRQSGRRVYGAWPGTDPKASIIWEAFKPESEPRRTIRSEEHTSELQSLMRISYAVFCLKKKKRKLIPL